VGLADAHAFLEIEGVPARDRYEKAIGIVRKALEIDDTLGEAHASMALLIHDRDWDLAGAEREYRRALELSPNYASAHHWYGELLIQLGRFDEGFEQYRRALEVNPLSSAISSISASVLRSPLRPRDRRLHKKSGGSKFSATTTTSPGVRAGWPASGIWKAPKAGFSPEQRCHCAEDRRAQAVLTSPRFLAKLLGRAAEDTRRRMAHDVPRLLPEKERRLPGWKGPTRAGRSAAVPEGCPEWGARQIRA
jgi:tetratricopeptide (TPR) repeat protein